MIYLDTSALIKLYVREPDSAVVQQLVEDQDDPLPIWDLQEMELLNALRLKVFWKEMSDSDVEAQMTLFEDRKRRGLYYAPEIDRPQLRETFHHLGRFTSELGCRTLDVLHVSCASLLTVDLFLSFDARQLALAERQGLKVYRAPGNN